jgi:demethylmenaquinone methyltransferase/2-methoxy-6-polyprenyl-1,4-benzoquinol methylase
VGDDRAVIDEQIAYYRARAGEYDDWWLRRDEFDLGEEFTEAWSADGDELRAWLRSALPGGDVLELAAGSGNWTAELLALAETVTAVDASPEMLALNRAKNAGAGEGLATVEADLFVWGPPRRYDAVFSSFWISHVPASHWADHWDLVDRALVPGGTALFLDNAHPDHARHREHADWPEAAGLRAPDRPDDRGETMSRRLRDGSTYEIVKRYWHPAELERDLAGLGWAAEVRTTSFAFLHGTARRARQ